MGISFGFGVFVGADFAGEINLNGIVRGAQQGGTIGYWIDQAKAGNRYIAEGVATLIRFSFEQLHLHRLRDLHRAAELQQSAGGGSARHPR